MISLRRSLQLRNIKISIGIEYQHNLTSNFPQICLSSLEALKKYKREFQIGTQWIRWGLFMVWNSFQIHLNVSSNIDYKKFHRWYYTSWKFYYVISFILEKVVIEFTHITLSGGKRHLITHFDLTFLRKLEKNLSKVFDNWVASLSISPKVYKVMQHRKWIHFLSC